MGVCDERNTKNLKLDAKDTYMISTQTTRILLNNGDRYSFYWGSNN
jgi:hypothetical protein